MTNNPYSDGGIATPVAAAPPSGTSERVETAKYEVAEVAGTAKQGAAEVAQETLQQAKVVTGVAKDHARSLVDETTTQLKTHAEDQAQRAANGLDQVATKVQALLSGRPEEAGELRDYAQELGDRAQQLAERLRSGGFDGVLSDASRFARTRPGLFLAGAATAGFFVGRMVKAQRSDGDGSQPSAAYRPGVATYEPHAYPQAYPEAYPEAGYRSTPGPPPLPDATTPPAVDAYPSVGAGNAYGTSRASTERETW